MSISGIPCALMRGGTSKGAYFLADDLPAEATARNRLLLRLMGTDKRQIDGLGGGDMLSSKVAIVSAAEEDGADVNYLFAQVIPGEDRVDTGPTCGNILAGVGAFAIERGLITAEDGETVVVVRDINTGARVEQVVQTPNRRVCYSGDCEISGVPGRAAPVMLFYLDFVGVKTGMLFPTGATRDEFDGVAATCIDAAMPTVFAAATDFGVSGYESREALQANAELFVRLERIRLLAGEKMGLGDVRGSVIPKFALVAAPQRGGAIASRYFTPVSAHAAFAVSGGIALASASLIDGTVPNAFATPPPDTNGNYAVDIEHPSGVMRITVRFEESADGAWRPTKAGVERTTRLIMDGRAFPADLD